MDEMREIVTMEQVNRWFLLLAIAAPIIGMLFGALAGQRRGQMKRGLVSGLAIGLLGPVNLLLWKVYNALTDQMGLDTVKNLLVQLGLFIMLGVIAGLVLGAVFRNWRYPNSGMGFGAEGGPLTDSGGSAPVMAGVGGGSPTRGTSAAKTYDEADELPRDP